LHEFYCVHFNAPSFLLAAPLLKQLDRC